MAVARSALTHPRPIPVRKLIAVAVLAVMAALYVTPVQKYLRVSRQVDRAEAQIGSLEREREALQAEAAALETKQRVVLLARECGWIFPGERALVVVGLPARKGAQCRTPSG